jgi:hypothetical protein
MSKISKIITLILCIAIFITVLYFSRSFIIPNLQPSTTLELKKFVDRDLPNFSFTYDTSWSVESFDSYDIEGGYSKFISARKNNMTFDIPLEYKPLQLKPLNQNDIPDCLSNDYSQSKQYNKFIAIKADVVEENKNIIIFEPIAKVWKKNSSSPVSSGPVDPSNCYNEIIKLQTSVNNIRDDKTNEPIKNLEMGLITADFVDSTQTDEIAKILDSITGLNI